MYQCLKKENGAFITPKEISLNVYFPLEKKVRFINLQLMSLEDGGHKEPFHIIAMTCNSGDKLPSK